MNRWTYFSDDEIKGLDIELVAKLDMARKKADIPFVITSGLRTCSANQAVGGVEHSSHIRGMAVDLRCDNSPDRFRIVSSLLSVGFTRLGIYDAHVHVDGDPSLPPEVIWIGVSH